MPLIELIRIIELMRSIELFRVIELFQTIELTQIILFVRVEHRGRLPGLRPGTIKKHLQHKRGLPLIELIRIFKAYSNY